MLSTKTESHIWLIHFIVHGIKFIILSSNNLLQPNNSNNDNCNLYTYYVLSSASLFPIEFQCSSVLGNGNGKYHQVCVQMYIVHHHHLLDSIHIFYAPKQIIYFALLKINYFMFVLIFSNRLILQALAIKTWNVLNANDIEWVHVGKKAITDPLTFYWRNMQMNFNSISIFYPLIHARFWIYFAHLYLYIGNLKVFGFVQNKK